jgi:hypothetical protein
VVSIQEAVMAGLSSVTISNALWDVAQGDQAAIGGQSGGPDPAGAILWYKKAWSLTCRVCSPTVTPLNGHKASIQVYGVPGQKYQLQASTDMVHWTTLKTVTMGSSGVYTYTDNATQTHEYYRVMPMP